MDFRSVSSRHYFLCAGVFLALIFTVIKPGFVGDAGFFTSLLFWSLHVGLLFPLLILVHAGLQSTPAFRRLNAWVLTGLAGALSAILFVPFALLFDHLFAFDDWARINTTADVLRLTLHEAAALILPVSICWVAINAPRILQMNFRIDVEPAADDTSAAPDRNRLLALIPKSIGTDVIYVASELHYLRVMTVLGDALVLYSLQNAVEDLSADYDGIQTHRSYWVNKRHVEKLVGKSGDRRILTRQGHLVPISRRQYRAVKDALDL